MLKAFAAVLDRVHPMVYNAEELSAGSADGLSSMDPSRPSHRAYARALQEKLDAAIAQTREARNPEFFGVLERDNLRISPYTLSLILECDEVLQFLQH